MSRGRGWERVRAPLGGLRADVAQARGWGAGGCGDPGQPPALRFGLGGWRTCSSSRGSPVGVLALGGLFFASQAGVAIPVEHGHRSFLRSLLRRAPQLLHLSSHQPQIQQLWVYSPLGDISGQGLKTTDIFWEITNTLPQLEKEAQKARLYSKTWKYVNW